MSSPSDDEDEEEDKDDDDKDDDEALRDPAAIAALLERGRSALVRSPVRIQSECRVTFLCSSAQ